MSNQTVQKKMLVIVGLLILAQSITTPAQAISFLPKLDSIPMYYHASTSDKVIVYTSDTSLSNKIVVIDNIDAEAKVEVNDGKIATIEEIKEYVLKEAKSAGLNPKEVATIVNCESRWDPKAKGHNTNGSYDLGLWQINSIHKNLSDKDKLDYKTATKWAIAKRLRDGNWSAWYCARRFAIK
jgi:hypothetical protein